MAEKTETKAAAEVPVATDQDKDNARLWFKKAAALRERRDYDYAIESYLTGLNYWPEAVEEGHKPLRSLAVQRAQAGGKKPGMLDGMKKPMTGKDTKQALLNALWLLSRDHANASYLDGTLKAAVKANCFESAAFYAPLVLESLRKDKKPSASRFRAYREALVEGAEKSDAAGMPQLAVVLYEKAVEAVEYLIVRSPGDMALRDEQRDLAGKLTIVRGKYGAADSFRESLQDADRQKFLHDADRVKQADQSLDEVIAAARREWEADPASSFKVNALIDALLKRERRVEEDEAIRLLEETFDRTNTYSFKVRADDIRLRQLTRVARETVDRARASGSEEDKQQARLAAMELLESELAVNEERVQKYPTDLKAKLRLGTALVKSRRYEEAIPILQSAKVDPRNRTRCELLIGRCFFETDDAVQAVDVLTEALEGYELQDDLAKELMYLLGRACAKAGKKEQALTTLGKLLRLDYNYAHGEARKLHDSLKA